MRRRARGFTLVEMMVAAGIASLLMIVVGALLVMVSRSYEEQRDRANLQNELLLAREDLVFHLTGAAIPVLPQSSEVVTASFRKAGKPAFLDGRPQWQLYLGFRKEGGNLVRLQRNFAASIVLPTLPTNLASTSGVTRTTVARNLSSLQFVLDGKRLESQVTVRHKKTTLDGRFSCLLQDSLLL